MSESATFAFFGIIGKKEIYIKHSNGKAMLIESPRRPSKHISHQTNTNENLKASFPWETCKSSWINKSWTDDSIVHRNMNIMLFAAESFLWCHLVGILLSRQYWMLLGSLRHSRCFSSKKRPRKLIDFCKSKLIFLDKSNDISSMNSSLVLASDLKLWKNMQKLERSLRRPQITAEIFQRQSNEKIV